MPIDLRTRKLAQLAVAKCVEMKKGDKVVLSGGSEAIPFLVELYKAVIIKGGIPILRVGLPDINDFFYKYSNKEQLEYFPDYWFDTVKQAQCYIGIDTAGNTRELTNCNSKKMAARGKIMHKISDYICNTRDKIKRVTIAYPCSSLAQDAEMSNTEYESFVYSACLQDWSKLKKIANKLTSKFKEGSKVHLIGENVDLKFSVHGKKIVSDLEHMENMPCGEVFMAPFRETMNGWIKFEYPSVKNGKEIKDICLKFENGKVIESTATKNQDFLRELIATDENSSYVGEFGIGINTKITKYTNNLLFDEKIGGTIHLALGMAYKENGGGNDSALHWDIVKDMKNVKMIVDGKVLQENKKWKV
jgi:aminopeptidase